MTKLIPSLAAAATLSLAMPTTYGQAVAGAAGSCASAPVCVYTASGQPVGMPVASEPRNDGNGTNRNILWRRYHGQPYAMNYSTSKGFEDDLILLYEQLNCSSTPYMKAGEVLGPGNARSFDPPPLGFQTALGQIWGATGPLAAIFPASFYYSGNCFNGTWGGNGWVPARLATMLEQVNIADFVLHWTSPNWTIH